MLRIRRTFAAEELGVRVDSHLALSPEHRLVAGRVDGDVVFDATLLPKEPRSPRSYLYVVLEGTLHLRRAAALAPPGTLVLSSSRDRFAEERWFVRAPFRILAVQLAPELLRQRRALDLRALGKPAIDAAWGLHRALSASAAPARFATCHGVFFDELRGLGVPIASRIDALASPDESQRLLALSRALTAALSVAGTRPALVDFAAASLLSERTARRAIPELAKTYGFAYTNWRTFRRAWSTVLACVLLTSPRASPAMVCRLTGFAGPASLCHALRRAGLQTPRDLQRRAQPLLST